MKTRGLRLRGKYPGRGRTGLQGSARGPVSNLESFLYVLYSVLRLRSQLTTPTPMLPNKIAPGAGMASISVTKP